MCNPEAPVGSIYSRKFNYLEEVEKNCLSVRKTLSESSLQNLVEFTRCKTTFIPAIILRAHENRTNNPKNRQ